MGRDYSVELAQPYDGKDYAAGISSLQDFISKGRDADTSLALVELVDDSSYPDKDYDFDNYAHWLEEQGFKPDLIAKESQIMSVCDSLRPKIDLGKLSPYLVKEFQTKPYFSQFFIATWCLMRLGYLPNCILGTDLSAEKLLNILPASFRQGEEESLEIIRSTPYYEAADKIEYIFIP